ncbi:MAG: sulfatase-like hydrolase/transferase [Roseitalea sp.]|jgi:hypothetical protein|nr:sulfatase-like hydrolase/transferase [Roseitalea sp.]MBO6721203.1 sulfatase-like hydrolase/transferase [Roseitalea sp.]MBO6744261.1 sulfatase-like hydrolase/transferase [Roseitalea sp.]
MLITTDQQRYDTIGALGFPHMSTPNLDRQVERGAAYTQCYTDGASYVVARAAMFTGMLPQNTGVSSFNQWACHRTWVHDLKRTGSGHKVWPLMPEDGGCLHHRTKSAPDTWFVPKRIPSLSAEGPT